MDAAGTRDPRQPSRASPGSRETVASRDEEIRALLASSRNVSKVLADRSDDLVDLMEQQRPGLPGAAQRARTRSTGCWSTPGSWPTSCAGWPRTTRRRSAPPSQEVDDLLDLLITKEKQLKATLAAVGPYASILGNIIGTGPWFDAYVVQPGRDPDRRVPARCWRGVSAMLSDRRTGGRGALSSSWLLLSGDVLPRPRRRGDPDRDRALPARGQRLPGHRRADPGRQRRPGDRGDPRGQLGARRDDVRRAATSCRPTPRP